jgi:hypothetical protein
MPNHAGYCRTLKHTDAAKRIADQYGLHKVADPLGLYTIGKFFAVAIADGTSDGTLYDTRGEAIRHQKHNETYYAYIQIVPSQMSVCDAEMYLSGVRKTYDARKNLMDRESPNGGKEIIPRLTVEDQRAQIAGQWQNLILPKGYR